ncbi:hypothetical protein ACFFMN_23535 [Planobispora siamensis]|uniref:Uncharacterized protein n=1 Tax=Planobispora siamensis TaxID=936338 RepID=A0A8J3SM18_9ACTN|nr:hypothetical protein [Planobispora siamensis]GIH95337.1 hypothetical protein Psi01_59670 [Planobispora siamensis]
MFIVAGYLLIVSTIVLMVAAVVCGTARERDARSLSDAQARARDRAMQLADASQGT